jgi:mannose-6-phosphate isomerase-like protein (cupin superfamily)
MADITVKRIEDFEGYQGQFLYAGKGLGVRAFGINVLKLPANWPDYPEHHHANDGQEEVYVVLKGSARLLAGSASWDLEPGMFARVGPAEKRKIIPGPGGVTILALGGTAGKPYVVPAPGKR